MPNSAPEGFSWVIPDLLAAMGRPRRTLQALEYFKSVGIGAIVSLTEEPLGQSLISEFGFEYHHIPIADFSAPDFEQVDQFVEVVKKALRERQKVLVHCLAGRGRTGTMLACYLVSEGRSPRQAVEQIRRLRPGSVETPDQEDAVQEYYEHVRRQGKGGSHAR